MMNFANSTPAPAFSADNLNQGDVNNTLQPENGNPKNKKKDVVQKNQNW